MKKLLIILAALLGFFAIVGVVVVAIVGVFFLTGGLVETADAFFVDVAAGNMDGAWSHLSPDFQAVTTREEFEAYIATSGLADYQSASWNSRQVRNNTGELEGSITTPGGEIPLKMTFVRAGSDWKIQLIEKEASGIAEPEPQLPPLAQCAELVQTTTRDFAAAVNNKDFTDFHATVAREFQEEWSPERFAETFSVFIEQEIDLSVLEGMEPIFTTDPGLAADGTLHLEGYFPSEPSRAHFAYNYVHRPDGWKLLGLDINIKPIEE